MAASLQNDRVCSTSVSLSVFGAREESDGNTGSARNEARSSLLPRTLPARGGFTYSEVQTHLE